MNCFDKSPLNEEEKKRLLKIIPVRIKVEKLLSSNFDTSKIKNLEDFNKATKELDYKSKEISKIEYSSEESETPLSGFTDQQIEEVVDNLIFIAAYDTDKQDGSLKPLESVDMTDMETKLNAIRNSIGADINPDIARNLEEVLKPKNLKALIEFAKAKLNKFNIDVDTEEDPDSKESGVREYEDSFLIANSMRARPYVKLLVASLQSDKPGTILGLKKFVNFDSTFKYLESILADTYIPKGEDAFEVFMNILDSNSKYKPELLQLKKHLESASIHHRVQFIRAFSTSKINYTNTIVSEGEDSKYKGFKVKYIDGDSMTPEKNKVAQWDAIYSSKFISSNRKEPFISKTDLANINKVINKYNNLYLDVIKRDESSEVFAKDIDNIYELLTDIGVDVDKRAIIEYMNTLEGSEIATLKKIYSELISKMFTSTSTSFNTLPKLKEGLIHLEDGYIKDSISNEKYFLKLAKINHNYSEDIVQNSFPGPDGKLYQTISQYDYVSKTLEDLKNGEDHLNKIKGSIFATNSVFKEALDNDKTKESVRINFFNNRALKGGDGGKTGKDISLIDEMIDRIDRVVNNGELPYFTLADKNRIYFIEGFSDYKLKHSGKVTNEMVDIFLNYLADELLTMSQAYDVVNNKSIPTKDLIKGYHYKNERGDNLGNAFTSTLFPSLNPGTEKAKELGLYDDNGKPLPLTSAHVIERTDGEEFSQGFYDNSDLKDYIKSMLELKRNETKDTLKKMFTFKKNKLNFTSLPDTLVKIIEKDSGKKLHALNRNELYNSLDTIALDYSFHTSMANVEWTKLFTGDPRLYKSLDDFTKRTPSTSATGDYLYINKEYGVNETFNIAIAPDFIEPSIELISDSHKENVAKWLNLKIGDPKIDRVLDSYKKVNRTDAQGWITLDRFREILKGLGDWNSEIMDPAFERLKAGKETFGDIDIFTQKMTTMQPKKGSHFELVTNEQGLLVPVYLKYSQAILFPGLVKSSPKLSKLVKAMENNMKNGEPHPISEVIVGDGVKSLKIGTTDIEADNIEFNSITLSNRNWKLQLDNPYKDKETNVGSQLQKNILADISLSEDFGDGRTGEDVIKDIHTITSKLSDKGIEKVLKKLGISKEDASYDPYNKTWNISDNANLDALYDQLESDYVDKGETGDIIKALKNKQPLELILSHANVLMSEVAAIFTNNSLKLKQPGGSAIQMSNYGFDLGDNRKTTDINNLPSYIKSEITWLKNTNDLNAPIISENYKTGELEFKKGECAIPYSALPKLFRGGKVKWSEIKKLPTSEIVKLIDPKALEIIGYRIPNQKLASNDVLKIVAILPPNAGNTIMSYSAITTKTGSDFDIDKMYYVMRPTRFNALSGMIEAVPFINGDNESDVAKRYEEYKKEILNTKSALEYLEAEGFSLKELRKSLKEFGSKQLSKKLLEAEFSFILDEEEAYEEIEKILGEGHILMSYEEFSTLPKIDQHTKAALQTKRVDLYSEVLSHPSSYLRMMSDVDPKWLSEHIKMMIPNKQLKDLDFYSPEYQIEIRRKNSLSKAGVGQTANNLTDHAISQWAKKNLKDLSDTLGVEIDLSRTFAKKFEEIVAYDKDNNIIKGDDIGNVEVAKYKKVSEKVDSEYITEIISAYMNAFVDAAKDNYIGSANFSTITNNTAFLLLRMGTSPQLVNAIMAQPIIKRYVELKSELEGQAVPSNGSASVMDKLSAEFRGEVDYVNLDKIDTVKLMNNLLDNGSSISTEGKEDHPNQPSILVLFLKLQDLSKSLNDSIKVTKSDTGIGTSLFDSYIMVNTAKNIKDANIVQNFDEIFEKDGVSTMAGTFYKNGPEAILSIIGKNTILNTSSMYEGLQKMYIRIWGEAPSDAKKVKKLYQLSVAALIHRVLKDKENTIALSKGELSKLISGDNNIANRTTTLLEKEKYKNNLLLNHLVSKVGYKDTISSVGINNAKPRTAKINQWLSNSWKELYNDPNTNEYAKDLARYAFYSSGFRDNLSSLHRLIPYDIYTDLGINNNTYLEIKKILSSIDSDTLSNVLSPQILKNLSGDKSIVPVISKSRRSKISNLGEGLIFGVSDKDAGNLIIGYDSESNPVFKPYVTSNIYVDGFKPGQKIKLNNLYEYVGNKVVPLEYGLGNVNYGVYKRVDKLGDSSGIFNLLEFNMGESDNSILNKNNINPKYKELINEKIRELNLKLSGLVNLRNSKIISNNLQESEKISSFEETESTGPSYSEYVNLAGEEAMSESDWDNMSDAEKENAIDCKGGSKGSSSKAEKGAQFGFTPGSKWKVIKDFKGKSHDNGGIDILIGKDGIKMSNKDGKFEAKNGCIINSKSLK